MIPFVDLGRQYSAIREEILAATDAVLQSGQLMNGTYTQQFENWLADRNRSQCAVCVHSGTAALEVIAEYYATLSVMPAQPRVLLPALTFAATANAFIRAGWDPVFIDTDRYGVMDYTTIPNASFDAVVLVGLYGAAVKQSANRLLLDWAYSNHSTVIIEDAAQHWLADGCVRFGDAAAISFDPMKNLANYGNGGAVVTENRDLAEFVRCWRDNAKPDHKYTATNSRMSEIDCATMLVKTKYLDAWQTRRRQIAAYWVERFADTPVRSLIDDYNFKKHAFHKFVIDVNHRDQVRSGLKAAGIDTRIHYERPLHEAGTFRQYPGPGMLAVSSALSRRVLSLPFYPELTDSEVEFIADQVLAHVS